MNNTLRGLIAGFVATTVLSALMLAKAAAGLVPQLDVIAIIGRAAGTGATPAVAWVIHFLIGTVAWGLLFALVAPRLFGDGDWFAGVVFAIAAWLLMMIVVMPLAGAGILGLNLGLAAPLMALALHIVFGAVLGLTYQLLPSPDRRTAAA